jgi:hypothetical protein
MIGTYPRKHLSQFTEADRVAARRYEQGKSHAKQLRQDLLGKCEHYDRGYADQSLSDWRNSEAYPFGENRDKAQKPLQVSA